MLGKILPLFLVAIGIGVGIFYVKTHSNAIIALKTHSPFSQKSVAGTSTQVVPPSFTQQELHDIQGQISNLKWNEIATSSPQIQAILQNIQQLPNGEAHDVCQKLCGSYIK